MPKTVLVQNPNSGRRCRLRVGDEVQLKEPRENMMLEPPPVIVGLDDGVKVRFNVRDNPAVATVRPVTETFTADQLQCNTMDLRIGDYVVVSESKECFVPPGTSGVLLSNDGELCNVSFTVTRYANGEELEQPINITHSNVPLAALTHKVFDDGMPHSYHDESEGDEEEVDDDYGDETEDDYSDDEEEEYSVVRATFIRPTQFSELAKDMEFEELLDFGRWTHSHLRGPLSSMSELLEYLEEFRGTSSYLSEEQRELLRAAGVSGQAMREFEAQLTESPGDVVEAFAEFQVRNE